jgi:alginate O-acetyltransferase complex protein AlgI
VLFNSIDFAVFLPVVFILYWFAARGNEKTQNWILLAASYFFYACWDWRFLFLIAASSFVDYRCGLSLSQATDEKRRKLLLLSSIAVNLGALGCFKYFNFFAESLANALALLRLPIEPIHLKLLLPVGISFYTLQKLTYTIDIYKRRLEPTRDVVTFFVFVSYFPLLLAGPIERAKNLLPQFQAKRTFDYEKAVDGLRQILWGLFKKVVIADNCAAYVSNAFAHHADQSGSTLLLGAVFFTFQIYCDFSGYSDIAIGTSRLFGIDVMRNFAFPYFSRDIAEFWRRWHIALSSWFRDYVYIPLGGSHGGAWTKVRNIFIVFILSGLWHGANWTFIVWGALNAFYFLPLMLTNSNRRHMDTVATGGLTLGLKDACQVGITFFITVIAWVFFRAESLGNALGYLRGMCSLSLFSRPRAFSPEVALFIVLLILVEWLQREKQHGLQLDTVVMSRATRWGIYCGLIWIILKFGGASRDFIYFQF